MQIHYSGMGTKKSGNHTEKEFLKIMDTEFKKDCAEHKKSLKCPSCKKNKAMVNTLLKSKPQTFSKKKQSFMLKQMKQCTKCKTRKTKKCSLDDYIVFSGANKLN